jgi:dolichol-phosphate mannosyltransferase
MLAVIIPTFNEAGCIALLLRRLCAALATAGIPSEAVVVDDNSPDGTAAIVEELSGELPVRVLRRPGKLGLASAVLHGMAATSADLIGVMDADLSHPPEHMPALVQALEDGRAQLAIGSRYVAGGGIQDWPFKRRVVSSVANLLVRPITPVRDATSGFFVVRQSALDGAAINAIGFKIGLEVIARASYDACVEVPYVFTDRAHGSSKFGKAEVGAYLQQLAGLYRERLFGPHPFAQSRRRVLAMGPLIGHLD